MSNFDAGFRTAAGGMGGGSANRDKDGNSVVLGRQIGRGQFNQGFTGRGGTPWTTYDSVAINGRRYTIGRPYYWVDTDFDPRHDKKQVYKFKVSSFMVYRDSSGLNVDAMPEHTGLGRIPVSELHEMPPQVERPRLSIRFLGPADFPQSIPVKGTVMSNYDLLDAAAKRRGYTRKLASGWIATMGDSTHSPEAMLQALNEKAKSVKRSRIPFIVGFSQTGNFSVGWTMYTKPPYGAVLD